MIKGFFPASSLQATVHLPLVAQCGACGLFKTCSSPKMPVTGQGQLGILVIAEAPGKDEDEQNRQLVSESGKLLLNTMRKYGVDMRKDCWLTNALICRPPNNRTPSEAEIGFCRPNLTKTLNELKPRLIIPLGGAAIKSLLSPLWKQDVGGISRWAGFQIPDQKLNSWICPTFHPSFILHEESNKKKNMVPRLLFEEHLQKALRLKGRPWDKIPDYSSKVRRIINDKEAAKALKLMMAFNGVLKPMAFDYETTVRKADYANAEIVCASVASSNGTISFPWDGNVIREMGVFLKSPIPKVGFNIKFEERFTHLVFGHGVNNWDWCGLLAAHVLDNRPDVTSLDFQSYALLGSSSHKDHLKKYLKGKGDSQVNQIKDQIDLMDLLLYCGLDSLTELEISNIQKKRMGV